MSVEENKALVRRIYEELWQEGNLDAIDKYYAADVVNHGAPPDLPPGREGFKVYAGVLTSAFSDSDVTIEDQIAEGDRVVTRWSSGKQVTVRGIGIERIADGKVAEAWGEFDAMGLMQQLGVLAPPG
jgi:predicted ester cyclase